MIDLYDILHYVVLFTVLTYLATAAVVGYLKRFHLNRNMCLCCKTKWQGIGKFFSVNNVHYHLCPRCFDIHIRLYSVLKEIGTELS